MSWNNISMFKYVVIAAAAGGSNALPRGRPQREEPTGQAMEGGGHSHSQRGDATAIATAASTISVAAALWVQVIVNIVKVVCGDILVARVEWQTESIHFKCQLLPKFFV